MTSGTRSSTVRVGVYYFDGWSGVHPQADNPDEPWARNAPTHLTRGLAHDYAEREPVWGWRNDAPAIMERQLDMAADNGVDFFAFCWYWHEEDEEYTPEGIANDSKHTSLKLYLQAPNCDRVKFCLLIANHAPLRIETLDAWKTAIDDHWIPYLKNERAVTIDGNPLVIIYDSCTVAEGALEYFQKQAQANGLPGVSIAGCKEADPGKGFQLSACYNTIPGYETDEPQEMDYGVLVRGNQETWTGRPDCPLIPTLTIGWDKRPWDRECGGGCKPGWHYTNRTPDRFAEYLQSAVTWMDRHPEETAKERVMMLYAWNEYGEGGYLAPTKGDPEASYLKEIKKLKDRHEQKEDTVMSTNNVSG